MFTNIHYLLRSRQDGSYLVARPRPQSAQSAQSDEAPAPQSNTGYLIMFQEHADGLSYLNAHAPDLAANFAIESVTQSQLKTIMARWKFQGIGMVSDPLLPKIQFLS